MKKILILAAVSLFTLNSYAQFSAGNLAVVRLGNGTQTLGNTGNSVFIDQFTVGGSLVNSVAIPDTAGNNPLIMNGASGSTDGGITRSTDGSILTIGGYGTAVGGSTVLNQVSGTAINRNVGVISVATGAYSLGTNSTKYSGNATTAGVLRDVVSDGSGNYWGTGSGVSGSTGLYYFGMGSPAAWIVGTGSPRYINIFGGNLYYSRAGSGIGIWTLSGTPTVATTPTQIITLASGTPMDFSMNAAADTIYLADSTLGIQKYTGSGTSWTLAYTLNSGVGFNGLAVDWSGPAPILYGTTANGSSIYAITDTGAGSAATLVAAAGANQVFKGIEFIPVPEPATTALLGLGLMVLIGRRFRFKH